MAKRIFHIAFAFRASEVRNDNDLRPFVHQQSDGRDRTVNAGGVGNVKILVHRDVQIGAEHNDLTVQIA